jgi:hypothetical protein
MYANTGIATDSARVARSARYARWLAKAARRLFITTPMPGLQVPGETPVSAAGSSAHGWTPAGAGEA